MPGISATIVASLVGDRDVIFEQRQPFHSFLSNFARDLHSGFSGVDQKRISVGGVVRSSITYYGYGKSTYTYGGFGITNGAGPGGSSGIVVGSSGDVFNVQQIKLGSEIAHGNAAGQLMRSTLVVGEPTVDPSGNFVSMTLSRLFANDSTEDVIVREVGLRGYTAIGCPTLDNFFFTRDVLETPITISPGKQLNVSIVFKTEL